MKVFEEHLKKDLIEIEEKIKIEDDETLLIQLKKDRKYILNYLFPNSNLKVDKTNLDLGITEINKDISKLIFINSQIYFSGLSGFTFFKNNDSEILKLFNEFIEKNEFGLKKIYDEAVLNDRIEYTKEKKFYSGCTIFIPSLNKNYFEIIKDKELYECNSKVHELGHAKINIESNEITSLLKRNSFLESFSIFLELIFSDFLKNNGKKKEGYQLKYLILNEIIGGLQQLEEELNKYVKYGETNKVIKFFFEKNYKGLRGSLFALYLYDLYLSDKKENLKIINEFVKYVKKLDDDALIKKFDINKKYLSDKYVYKLSRQLEQEKIKIKQK